VADLSPASDTAAARPHGLDVVTGSKPRPEPLDPPMVPFAVGGMLAFALAAVICWLAGAPDRWWQTCVAGVIVGIPGLITMIRHDAHRRRRRALSHPEFTVDDPA
jgi:uncharacterized membrane protein